MNHKKLEKAIVRLLISIPGIIAVAVTLFLFGFVFWKGKSIISLEFITQAPGGMPFGTDGGIFPALMGSLMLGGLSALVGGFVGIFCSIYLVFGKQGSLLYKIVKISITALSGIPSIIYGLVGYTFLIFTLGFRRSLLSSAITISVMILPFVAIRAEKIFRENGMLYMKESISHGISREYTLRKIILPSCMAELISTVALGMAYGMGAVAPILYTGVVMQADVPQSLSDPFMSLPYHLYMLVNNGFSLEYAYGTAFVLMALLLCIQLLCKGIAYLSKNTRWKRKR